MQLKHGHSFQPLRNLKTLESSRELEFVESEERDIRTAGYSKLFNIPGTFYSEESLQHVVDGIDKHKIPLPPASSIHKPAGLTYFGQFVDHDITRMSAIENPPVVIPAPASTFVQKRSPSLDLDSVYGEGLKDPTIPYDGARFSSQFMDGDLIYDLPRGKGDDPFVPLVGDDRNDENLIIAQLHTAFLNMHNRLVDVYSDGDSPDTEIVFEAARRELVLLYQLVLVNDFLKTFLDKQVFDYLFGNPKLGFEENPTILNSKFGMVPTIPLEFAGAAFRFGHSLVRESYLINEKIKEALELRTLFFLTGKGKLDGHNDLRNHRVDWKFLLPINGSRPLNTFSIKPVLTKAMRKLVLEFSGNKDLLLRNLKRGSELGLSNAQAICEFLASRHPLYVKNTGLEVLSPEQIETYGIYEELAAYGLDQNTPLWLYVLMEPFFNDSENMRLGKLGSIIIGETFRAIINGSRNSIYDPTLDLNGLRSITQKIDPGLNWNDLKNHKHFTLANLIQYFDVNSY